MSSYYNDDANAQKVIMSLSFKSKKRKNEIMEELCRFRANTAGQFIGFSFDINYNIHYQILSRSDLLSDRWAKLTKDFLENELESADYTEAVNKAYYLLHMCRNKESDAMLEVYRTIGKKSQIIKDRHISWEDRDIISPYFQPELLYRMSILERQHFCETGFFEFLNDTIILTMMNAILCDGEDETFTQNIRELYEEFPDVYSPAGFFAYFIKDTSEAYDRFKSYLEDPLKYPHILWVLDGVERENGRFIQGSPTAFVGENNEKRHYSLPIPNLDFRWIEFLTQKPIEDIGTIGITDIHFIHGYLSRFSDLIIHIIDPSDERIFHACTVYYKQTVLLSGSAADFAGLTICGGIRTPEEMTMLGLEIAKRICEGKMIYCFRSMFAFIGFDYNERLSAIKEIAAYLREHEHSEEHREQRNDFFRQAELYNAGKPSAFDGD